MAFVDKLDRFLFTLQGLTGSPATQYIGLETADGILDHALVTQAGGLMSIIEIEGARSMADGQWLQSAINQLDRDLKTRLETAGHTIQIVWDYDPGRSNELVADCLAGMYQANRELGAGFGPILDDWVNAVTPWCARESVFLAIGTESGILTKTERDRSRRARREAMKNGAPIAAHGQALSSTLESLRDRHDAMVTGIDGALHTAGIIGRTLDAHEACHRIRSGLDPEFTAPQWRASLPGDPLPLRVDDTPDADLTDEVFLYPDLPGQLMPRAAEVFDIRTVRVGDRLHMPLFMKRPPQHPEGFQRLFARMLNSPFPWRMSIRIGGDGLSGFAIAQSLATVLRFTSRENQLFNAALSTLEQRALSGEAIVRFQVEFDTWIHADVPDAKRYLVTRASRLAAAVQAWGSADVEEVIGDPLIGVTACVPATMTKSPAKAAAAPLQDALLMMPITRPAKIWKRGIPLRTPDGKLVPHQAGTSEQTAWIELYVAPMGSGKSVSANTFNFAFLLEPGVGELPYLLIVDIGASSSGLIEALRDDLPTDKKHLAAHKRLRMTPEDAINPFDTMLFCPYPTPLQKTFLRNFLTQIATPLNSKFPPNGILGLIEACIDRAYEDLAPDRHPREYHRGADSVVDATVDKLGLQVEDYTTYWDLVEKFYDASALDAAAHAQRLAVPLLHDIAKCARNPEIMDSFSQIVEGGQTLCEYFWRACIDAVRLYPVLSGPTRFNVGSARVVSIDLDEVAKHGTAAAERQSAIMYMLARHAGASHFFYQPEDLQYVPAKYRAYHRPILENLRTVPKRIFYDEWHRVSQSAAVAEQIASDINTTVRESRKWNIHVALASQDIGDFADFIIDLATSVFVLGVGNPAAAETITKRLKLPPGALAALNTLRAPGSQGAEMLAIFRTTKHQSVVQKLVNTIGLQLRMALDSSAETATVRRRLTEALGSVKARALLGQYYPGGVKEEIERRNYAKAQSGLSSDEGSINEEIVGELIAKADTVD